MTLRNGKKGKRSNHFNIEAPSKSLAIEDINDIKKYHSKAKLLFFLAMQKLDRKIQHL